MWKKTITDLLSDYKKVSDTMFLMIYNLSLILKEPGPSFFIFFKVIAILVP